MKTLSHKYLSIDSVPTHKVLRYLYFAVIFFTISSISIVVTSCRNNDLWDEMPQPIALFISNYFPGNAINSYSDAGNTYHVRIDDGPGLTFDSGYKWIAIDGYGMPMPQVLLFDQLPPKLYGYLQDTDQLNEVFSMERDHVNYIVTLMDSTLKYVIETGELTTVTLGTD